MRVGTLEIQIMAGLARLQKDMNDAQRMVGGAMGNVERSVARAGRAMQTLGAGIPIGMMVDQVRRMTDQYTKLDAQLRLATKSQAEYAQGMADVRRISTIAQADISATSMLYTRLLNVMDGTGVSQQKLATVTETVSFGLKAYGATTQEAASAALQLSQAMGANRLGGEEFRAVMEAMPNVMKVLADSMGVPLGELRALSIAGKITADEMIKAFGNPAVAAQFKALAESTQTVTGAWQVARNELMLLVGEFSKSSGLTQGAIAAFNAFGAVFRFMSDNIDLLTRALGTYIAVMAGKLIVGLVQARMAQIAASAAAAEAAAANVAVAEAALFAAKANLAGAAAAARAGGSMAVASAAAKEYTAALAALAAAEKAQAASSIGIMGRIKGLAGKAGWIGMALFGAWSVYDFLNGMQQVADGADKLKNKFEGMSLAEVQMARQKELIRQIGMRGKIGDVINEKDIRQSQDMIREYDAQIAKMAEMQNAEARAAKVKVASVKFSHDEQVMIERYNDLLDKKNKKQLTEAEFAAKIADVYGVGAKAAKAAKAAGSEPYKTFLAEQEGIIRIYSDYGAREVKQLERNHALKLLSDEDFFKQKTELLLRQNEIEYGILGGALNAAKARKDKVEVAEIEARRARLKQENIDLTSEFDFDSAKRELAAREAANKVIDQATVSSKEYVRQFQLENSLLGKSALEVQKLTSAHRIEKDLEKDILAIRNDAAFKSRNVNAAVMAQYEAAIKGAKKAADAAKEGTDVEIEARDRVTRSWEYGASEAIRKYDEAVRNSASQAESLYGKAFKSAEDAIVKALTTGKLEVRDFATTVAEEFARIKIAQPLVSAGANILSQISGDIASSLNFPSFAGGGSTGDGPRTGGVDGMGGFPAILHPKETVIDHTRGGSTATAPPSVTVIQNINIDSRSDAAVITASMQRAAKMAEAAVMQSLQRGGSFAQAVGRAG